MVSAKLVTAEELFWMPEDGFRYDLILGVLHPMPYLTWQQGIIGMEILVAIGRFIGVDRLGHGFAGETGFLVARDPDTVLAPDFAFIGTERMPPWSEMEGYGQLAPDLAVEIISPTVWPEEVRAKVDAYLEAEVGALWLVDHIREEVTVYRPGQPPQVVGRDEELDGGDILPGFRLPLTEIFREEWES